MNAYEGGVTLKATVQMTIRQASDHFGMSESTIKRHIQEGRIEAKKEDGHWMFTIDQGEPGTNAQVARSIGEQMNGANDGVLVHELRDRIAFLEGQIREKDGQLGGAIHAIREMQVQMLPPPKDSRPWWRKLFNIQAQSQENKA